MNWRVVLIDLGTVTGLYLVAAFIATQTNPVVDWREWGTLTLAGVGYRLAPEVLQYLTLLRAKYVTLPPSGPPPLPDEPLVIGDVVESESMVR